MNELGTEEVFEALALRIQTPTLFRAIGAAPVLNDWASQVEPAVFCHAPSESKE